MDLLSVTWNCGINFRNHLRDESPSDIDSPIGDSPSEPTLNNVSLLKFIDDIMKNLMKKPKILFISLQELPYNIYENELRTLFDGFLGYNIKYVYTKNPSKSFGKKAGTAASFVGVSDINFKLAIIVMSLSGSERKTPSSGLPRDWRKLVPATPKGWKPVETKPQQDLEAYQDQKAQKARAQQPQHAFRTPQHVFQAQQPYHAFQAQQPYHVFQAQQPQHAFQAQQPQHAFQAEKQTAINGVYQAMFNQSRVDLSDTVIKMFEDLREPPNTWLEQLNRELESEKKHEFLRLLDRVKETREKQQQQAQPLRRSGGSKKLSKKKGISNKLTKRRKSKIKRKSKCKKNMKRKKNNKTIKGKTYKNIKKRGDIKKGGGLFVGENGNQDTRVGVITVETFKGCIYLYDSQDDILYATVHLPFADGSIIKLSDILFSIIKSLVEETTIKDTTKIIIAGDFNSRVLVTNLCSIKNNDQIESADGELLKLLNKITELVKSEDDRLPVDLDLIKCREMVNNEHVDNCVEKEIDRTRAQGAPLIPPRIETISRQELIKYLAELDYLPKSIKLAIEKCQRKLRVSRDVLVVGKVYNILNNMMLTNPNNRYGLPVSYKFSNPVGGPETVDGPKEFSYKKGDEGRDPSIGDITLVSFNRDVSGFQISKMVGNDHATVATYLNFY